MDLEVVGRHALLFDDDAMSLFVNSGDALVEWNSLQIDRYDVRHLLSAPPPPRRRRVPPPFSSHTSDEAELDHERYLDLPSPSDEPKSEEGPKAVDAGGYRAVAFSYGNDDEPADERNVDGGQEYPGFRPSFPVPDSLLHSLPPSEKVHQIIARTALFVCKHGGQSEIVLRVKQGDNPTFGFLMPDHHLHAYFRFLVDHPELLQSDGNLQMEERRENNEDKKSNAVGGALSLLGSVYGSGEDEDGTTDDNPESNKTLFGEKFHTVSSVASQGSGRSESSPGAGEKDDAGSKLSLLSQKVKAPVIKKNPPVNPSRARSTAAMKKEDGSSSLSAAVEKLKDSAVGTTSKVIIEPPSDIKRTIDKIVEFIAKNGKQFEATLIEQDSKHGRFPFLLPSNQYHPFYLKVLQRAQESKLSGGRSFLSGKDDSAGLMAEKKAFLSKENDSLLFAPAASDVLLESDRKEKFKMVIGKAKKDDQDAHSKETPQDFGVTVDAAAAAAILQAAARGIRNPDLGIVSSAFLSDKLNGQSSEVGQGSSLSQRSGQNGERSASIPVAEEEPGEADSSEALLTKEEKLKAERRKRAKMFVAMLKGAAPAKTDQSRGSSVEPQASAALEAGTEVDLSRKEKEGSTAPPDDDISDKNDKLEAKLFNDENNERRSKRKYRSRSERHDEEEEEGEEEEEEEDRKQKSLRKRHRSPREDEEEGEKGQKEKDRRHSKRKKHHSRRSSLADKDCEDKEEEKDHKRSRRKHRSRHGSEEDDNDKEEDQSESFHRSLRRKHQSRHSSDENSDGKEEDDSGRYHRRSRRKHRSHRFSDEDDDGKENESDGCRKSSRRKHSSHQSSHEEGDEEYDDNGRDRKRSRKKHRSRSSSRRSWHSRKHSKRHSSKDKVSPPELKHDNSSDDEYLRYGRHAEQHKESSVEELEEGEIGSKFSDQSRGSGSGRFSCEASQEVASSHREAPSQPPEAPGVSDDLRAKVRAMLMATRS